MSFLYYLVLLLVLHALKQPIDQASARGQLVMPPLNVMIGPSYRTCHPEAMVALECALAMDSNPCYEASSVEQTEAQEAVHVYETVKQHN